MDNKLQIQIVQNLVPVLTANVTIGGGKNITFGDTMTGTGTPTDPINVSNTVLQQISDNSEQSAENASQISDIQNTLSNVQDDVQNATEQITDIQSVIPATANPENPLVDQGFVNSSIQTATAYFRGDWATWTDVPSDPALYPADATGNRTPITNDYMVVISDEKTNGGTWRYKYTGVWAEQGKAGWLEEYQVNETPFTAAQNAALNSGVTAQAVANIATNKSNITALQNGKQDKLTAGDGITIEGNTISASGGGGGASLPDQTGNAGKFLTTDGTTASWGEALKNNTTIDTSVAILGTTDERYNYKTVVLGVDASAGSDGVCIGYKAKTTNLYGIAIGESAQAAGTALAIGPKAYALGSKSVAIGVDTPFNNPVYASGVCSVAFGPAARANADYAMQFGYGSNSDANTIKFANYNGNFEMMDANGNVPLGRLTYVTQQIGDISTALTAILGE